MKTFTLEVITQEKHLLTETVDRVTVSTQVGEITVLADHLPLFSRLMPCELSYSAHGNKHSLAITGGFIDVSPRNVTTILADSAVRSEEINLAEVEKAVAAARKALETSPDQAASLKIEMELRAALIKQKIAQKHQKSPLN